MIEFACDHCGETIRYPDSHAGRQGRCPACGALVQVPRTPAEPLPDEDVARAVRQQAEEAAAGRVPPPPSLVQPSLEDLDLANEPRDPMGETDIIPSDQVEALDTADYEARRRAAREARRAIRHPATRPLSDGQRTATLVAIAIIVLLIAVVSVLLLFSLR